MITDITIVSPGENPDLLICSLFGFAECYKL